MIKKNSSMDGFIPRRAGSELGQHHKNGHVLNGSSPAPRRKELRNENDLTNSDIVGRPRAGRAIGQQAKATEARRGAKKDETRSDITASLNEIDDLDQKPGKKLSRRDRRRIKRESRTRTQRIRRRIILGLVWLLVAGIIGIAAFFAMKVFGAGENVLQGNIFDIVQHEPLKQDENGRSNFLIVGTSEDDPGHQGANLTDSIMVLSINQTTKDAYTFSIPRDLEVKFGKACIQGYSGKINEYFSCSDQGTDDAAEQNRLAMTQALIGDIVGMDIQYGVHVNYTVMRDVVNAIGGSITVNIESRDPRGQMDSNFDWKCGPNYAARKKTCPPNGHFIDYPNGPAVLDAEHALYLAQARGDIAPTYGFEQSNFDRERNQQKILVAIRDKALSAGTLTNIGSVTGLIDALGNNLRTNIQTKEIRTLMELAQAIPNDKIKSIDLNKEGEAVFTGAAQPVAGMYNYTQIRAYINKIITQEPFVEEKPNVMVLNGSGVAGVAQMEADKLEVKGFIIGDVANAPEGTYPAATVYQINNKKPLTAEKLKKLYNVALVTTTPPVSVMGDTDFVIIIGSTSTDQ